MRAAPACQVPLLCLGAWRAAVGAVSALGATSLTAWAWTLERPVHPWLWTTVAVTAVVSCAATLSLTRRPATQLRWDGRVWHLDRERAESVSGDVCVALDLGPWMLLRFNELRSPGMEPRVVWLPVQRRGLELQWHALRCAVYSPREVGGAEASTDG